MTNHQNKQNEITDNDPFGVNDEPGIGHNSGGVAGERLNAFIERIERMEEEKAATMEDIKEIYAEAKGVGFDTKTIRKIVSRRKKSKEKVHEEDELLELYELSISGINSMME